MSKLGEMIGEVRANWPRQSMKIYALLLSPSLPMLLAVRRFRGLQEYYVGRDLSVARRLLAGRRGYGRLILLHAAIQSIIERMIVPLSLAVILASMLVGGVIARLLSGGGA